MMESLLNLPLKSQFVVKSEPISTVEDEEDEQETGTSLIAGLLMRDNNFSLAKAGSVSQKIGNTESSVLSSSSTPPIHLGQTFSSFATVSHAIRAYESANKVNLTQKYFRRIAANPKPSNKEDSSLSVEERKRFVYRWVDFCCTYFDTLLARTNVEEDGTAPAAAIRFTIKECPMRIRFQMRFKEKDLIVSIFRETHDHTHPDADSEDSPQSRNRPTNSDDSVPGATSVSLSNQVQKQNLRPPPSLAPLPNRQSSSFSSSSNLSSPSPLSTKRSGSSMFQPNLPRPPPLKKGPLMLGEHSVPHTSTSCQPPPNRNPFSAQSSPAGSFDDSAKTIIRNIYNYLLRAKMLGNQAIAKTGIVLTSASLDLIKLTSEIAGVEQSLVRQVALGRPSQSKRELPVPISTNSNFSRRASQDSATITVPKARIVKYASRRPHNSLTQTSSVSHNYSNSKRFRIDMRNDSDSTDDGGAWASHFNLNNADSKDAYNKLANLPLDITIKPDGNFTSEEEDYDYSSVGYPNDYDHNDDQDQDQELFYGEPNGR